MGAVPVPLLDRRNLSHFCCSLYTIIIVRICSLITTGWYTIILITTIQITVTIMFSLLSLSTNNITLYRCWTGSYRFSVLQYSYLPCGRKKYFHFITLIHGQVTHADKCNFLTRWAEILEIKYRWRSVLSQTVSTRTRSSDTLILFFLVLFYNYFCDFCHSLIMSSQII